MMTLWFRQAGRQAGDSHSRRVDLDSEPCPTICKEGVGDTFGGPYWLEDDGMAKMRMRRVGVDKGSEKSAAVDLDASPCPCIQKTGLGGVFHSEYEVEPSGRTLSSDALKPRYAVPTMDEVRSTPWNGFTVASTFAGCGGSSTGYRMAGFKVVYANEFDRHALECYAANKAAHTVLDGRDIHMVTPEEVLEKTRLAPGELDILDGSPPCQTFSTAGKRDMGDPRSTLFFEYIRLLRGLRPKVFVAENVSGLVKGVAKGYFKMVLAELKASGYRVECRLLDAQWLGVPQQRQRVIFVGVREDLCEQFGVGPVFPKPMPYRYSVMDACPWIGSCVHDTAGQFSIGEVASKPAPAVMSQRSNYKVTDEPPPPELRLDKSRERACDGEQVFGAVRPASPAPTIQTVPSDTPLATERRKFTIAELRRICSFPDDFALPGSYANQWARLGNSVPPLMMRAVAEVVRDEILRKIVAGVPRS